MKKLIYLIAIFISFSSAAQDSTITKKNIAIVPFMPQMYFNDLSRLWSQTGESFCQEKQIEEISKQVFKVLQDSLILKYHLIDLTESNTLSTKDYLLEFYGLASFAYNDTFPQKKSKSKLKIRKKKERSPDVKVTKSGEIGKEKNDTKYQFLNTKIRSIKDFKASCRELELDGVLYVNQIEIKGDFGSPYNSGRETNYYIIIHYALFNSNGELRLGNKTNNITTNEKARYHHFIENDLSKAAQIMASKIKETSLIDLIKYSIKSWLIPIRFLY